MTIDPVPSVSIVLPVFNGARYLAEAIQSVLAQDFTDFELLIGDDASADASRQIIEGFRDNRIHGFSSPRNIGLFPNLNRLIRDARAPLVRLWAQDDRMTPRCLSTEVDFHHKHPEIGMSYCFVSLMDEHGAFSHHVEDATPEIVSPSLASQIMFFHGSITGNIANVMLKRSALDDVGLFREDMKVSGDFEMWVRIARRYPIGCIHERLINLRQHSAQFSRMRGVGVDFAREDEAILDELFERLPEESRSHARRYRRCHIERQQVHYMLRSLVAGDWHTAAKSYHQLRRQDRFWPILLYWLISGNGRWLRPKPRIVLEPNRVH